MRNRLHLVPPFRRKLAPDPVQPAPPGVGRGRRTSTSTTTSAGSVVPAPGSEKELAELVGDIASRPLDRTRPLWEMYIVEGLQNGYVASVAKMHHATIDGVSGANLMVHLFDLEPDPPSDELEDAVGAGPHADRRRAVRVRGRVAVAASAEHLQGAAADGAVGRQRRASAAAAATAAAWRRRSPRRGRSFNQPVTPHRRVAFATTSLDEVKEIKKAFGATVNDVVLDDRRRRAAQVPRRTRRASRQVADRDVSGVGARRGREGRDRLATACPRCSRACTPTSPIRSSGCTAIHEANKGAKEEHNAIGADLLHELGRVRRADDVLARRADVHGPAARRASPGDPQPRDLERPGATVPAVLRGSEARRA